MAEAGKHSDDGEDRASSAAKAEVGSGRIPLLDLTNPATLIYEAAKRVGIVWWFVAVGAVLAVVFIVSKYQIPPAALVLGGIGLLIGVIALIVTTALVGSLNTVQGLKALSLPMLVLLWSFLALLIFSGLFTFTSFFFDSPLPLKTKFFPPPVRPPPTVSQPAYLGPAAPLKFTAVTELPGVQGRFEGTVLGGAGQIRVKVTSAILSFPKASSDGGGRYISYYRALLVEQRGSAWIPLSYGQRQWVGKTLDVGHTLSLDAQEFGLATQGVTTLNGRWLVFEIGVALSPDEAVPGTTYAHTEPHLF